MGRPVFLVRNEFAVARVSLDECGNGPRLLIEDLRTGARQYFDALQLVSLAEADPRDWEFLMDPARLLAEDPHADPELEERETFGSGENEPSLIARRSRFRRPG